MVSPEADSTIVSDTSPGPGWEIDSSTELDGEVRWRRVAGAAPAVPQVMSLVLGATVKGDLLKLARTAGSDFSVVESKLTDLNDGQARKLTFDRQKFSVSLSVETGRAGARERIDVWALSAGRVKGSIFLKKVWDTSGAQVWPKT